MKNVLLCASASLAFCVAAPAASSAPATVVTPLAQHALEGLPGKAGALVKVDYPPGGSDPIHRHDASVFVYVLQGSVVMEVRGGKPVTLQAGQTFFEGPADVHLVGRNASDTEPASFLAFFVKDAKAPFVLPAH